MHPLVSIIIPTYNSAGTIQASIHSILEQEFDDFEILIQDGNSKDNTLEIVNSFKDVRIRIDSCHDGGVYDAMNKAIDRAKGSWLYFLGSDDVLHDNKVLLDIFTSDEVGNHNIVYGNVSIIGNVTWAKDREIYDGIFNLRKLLSKNICHQSIFYRKNFVEEIGFYNTNYKIWADWDFNLRCWASTAFLYTDRIIADFYAGGESSQGAYDSQFSKDYFKKVKEYFKLSVFDPLIYETPLRHRDDVIIEQKKRNYFKYLYYRVKSVFD